MEVETRTTKPSLWKALLIGNGYYKTDPLIHSKADLERVYYLCKTQLNIHDSDICMMYDKTAEEVQEKYKSFIFKPSKNASENNQYG